MSAEPSPIRFDRFSPEHGASSWTGPWVEAGFPIREVVASWNVELPPRSAIEVEAQLRDADRESRWFSLGRWAPGASGERTSVAGQRDRDAEVVVDRLVCHGMDPSAYRVRVSVDGPPHGGFVLRLLAAMASGDVPRATAATSLSRGTAVELDVPTFSQQVHRGTHLELDGGGASWCSPASTAMVLGFWGRGPGEADLAGIDTGLPDRAVVHAARHVFDPAYGGTGNWSFNVAYAGQLGLEAFVTRLRSLREAEPFLAAGIPLVLSIAAAPGALSGFPLPEGTRGHLLVLVGVTGAGDPVVNDPAAPENGSVRRVYDRGELERAWLGASGGVVFVIHPPGLPLPPTRGSW